MSTTHTPIGPTLTFERGKRQPVILSLTTSAGAALDIAGKTLRWRIGVVGSAALYEVDLEPVTDGSDGRAAAYIEPDIVAASYEYHVEDVDAARILVRGACSVRAVIAAAG